MDMADHDNMYDKLAQCNSPDEVRECLESSGMMLSPTGRKTENPAESNESDYPDGYSEEDDEYGGGSAMGRGAIVKIVVEKMGGKKLMEGSDGSE